VSGKDRPVGLHHDGPDADGFEGWIFGGDGYNVGYGRMLARAEGKSIARVRIATGPARANVLGSVHGGFLLAFLDQALFVGQGAIGGVTPGNAVTLNIATQFVSPGRIGAPLDCVVEMVRETGRLVFLRGTLEQGDNLVMTYQATMRKLRQPAG
jgi:acyl-coenzyme A thioesterase PaaI-like protein